jgi:PAS domain S-box-containing protein
LECSALKFKDETLAGLVDSEDAYRTLIDATGDWLWEINGQDLFTYVSPAVTQLLGYEVEEVLGMKLVELVSPQDRERIARMLPHSPSERRGDRFVGAFLHKDGTSVRLTTNAVALAALGEQAAGYRGISRPAAERRSVVEALSETERRFKSILDHSTTVIYVKDPEGRYLQVNRRYEELFHITNERIAGKTDWDVFPKRIAESLRESDARVLLECKPIELEEEYPHDDGPHVYLSVKFPLTNGGGRAYAVCGIATDITDRINAQRALRASDERFKSLSESAQDAVVMMDAEGKVTFWNQAAVKMFGWSRQEAMGSNCHSMVMPERFRPLFEAGFSRFNVSGDGSAVGKTLELVAARKDGTEFPIEISVAGVQIEGEWSAIGIVRDITDRKRAHEQLVASKAEVEDKARLLRETTAQLVQSEKLTALGELSAGAAHEMNQPLNGIKIIAQGLLSDIQKRRLEVDELEPCLGDIVELVNRLASIVDQMRLFSRKPGIVPMDEGCDANAAIEGVFKMLAEQLRAHGFETEKSLGENLPLVKLDLIRLEQVLMNLIINARDAVIAHRTNDKQIAIRSRFVADAFGSDRAGVVVEVQDNGRGMAEAEKLRAFEPFFTTKQQGKGTGLGLSIVERIVTDSGGRIEIESDHGRGTLMRLILAPRD